MYRIIARVLTCCCLFITPGAFAEEASKAAPEPNNGCARVHIYIESRDAKVARSGIGCDHGNLIGVFPSEEPAGLVVLEQSTGYGPDCSITIQFAGGGTGVLRVQQNYCALKSGTLSPTVVSGPVRILRYEEGDWSAGRPGQVWVEMKKAGGK